MLSNRVIPVLLLKNNGLVKTCRFKNPKYVGDPINAIKIFNKKEVDELVVLDIEASKKNHEPNYKLIEKIELKDIKFSYENKNLLFDNLNLIIKNRTKVMFVFYNFYC